MLGVHIDALPDSVTGKNPVTTIIVGASTILPMNPQYKPA